MHKHGGLIGFSVNVIRKALWQMFIAPLIVINRYIVQFSKVEIK